MTSTIVINPCYGEYIPCYLMMVSSKPEQFLACTSLTVEAFDILLPSFSQAWNDYVKKNYVNSGGGKPKIPQVTDNCLHPFLL